MLVPSEIRSAVVTWPGDYPPDRLRVRDAFTEDLLWEVDASEPGRFELPIEPGIEYHLSFQGVWSRGLLGLGLDWLLKHNEAPPQSTKD